MILTPEAEKLINQYAVTLAKAYSVATTKHMFTISQPQEIKLRKALLDSTAFLKEISMLSVNQIKGAVVEAGVSKLLTGRKKDGRFGVDLGVDGNEYELRETDSCARLKWALLAVWANSGTPGEFFKLVTEFANESFALDILRIGFNGKSFAENTDPVANPNGEDVNKGWHQISKEYDNGSHVLTAAVSIGAGGDYLTLDAAALDVIAMLPAQFREHPQLTVLAGSDLIAAEQLRMANQTDKPTEKAAFTPMLKSIAGRRHVTPPFFPGKRITVTIPKNLHCYTQTGTQRREAKHVGDRKAFESSWWRMQGYALEIPALYAAIDEAAVTIK